jgi:hypothetical protein
MQGVGRIRSSQTIVSNNAGRDGELQRKILNFCGASGVQLTLMTSGYLELKRLGLEPLVFGVDQDSDYNKPLKIGSD